MNTILSIFTKHDANLSVSISGKIVRYLEIEKIARRRYFSFSEDPGEFREEFKKYAMPYLKKFSPDCIVLSWVEKPQEKELRELFPEVQNWKYTPHHFAHAWSSYVFTAPDEKDLIVSYDGGGELFDTFKVFEWQGRNLTMIEDIRINLGLAYRALGVWSSEISLTTKVPNFMDMTLPGKVMALAGYGKMRPEYIEPLRRYYLRMEFAGEGVHEILETLRLEAKLPQGSKLPDQVCRDLLASSQHVFESFFEHTVYPYLETGKYRRLIITGGCALNVKMNSKAAKRWQLPVFIPPCPNDCGISLGSLLHSEFDWESKSLSCCGIDLEDKQCLPEYADRYKGLKASCRDLAQLLLEGKIIGVLNGPLEIGPRALGNRSLLASPLIDGMQTQLNQIKEREGFRPVAPIVSERNSGEYFDTIALSPYMSFAPPVREEYRKILREVIHVDGTARIQTVPDDGSWISELLSEFGKLSGYEILINTSFNSKGLPLINNIDEVLTLKDKTGLDAVFVEGILFT